MLRNCFLRGHVNYQIGNIDDSCENSLLQVMAGNGKTVSFIPAACLATWVRKHFLATSTAFLVSLLPGLLLTGFSFSVYSARCTGFSKFCAHSRVHTQYTDINSPQMFLRMRSTNVGKRQTLRGTRTHAHAHFTYVRDAIIHIPEWTEVLVQIRMQNLLPQAEHG